MLSLIRDPAFVNAVINHPGVRPFVGAPDAGPLDISPLVARPENLFPFGEFGGFSLVWTAPATREVHTFIVPEGRGAWARQAARDGIALAAENGTERLWTKIGDLPNVRAFAVEMGMRPTGEKIEGLGQLLDIYEMPCR